jgi:MFS transporter, OPA family, glycerol-3-phosphate transporter
MYPSIVGLCLVIAVSLYFYNNPLHHSRWFMLRRFINWFPLGMTYAFLYMGRYNLAVSKNALGTLMSNKDFGWIFAIGTWTYAGSFLINGPLVDKIGGKRGIIIAALGASAANIALGVLTYLLVTHQLKVKMVVAFSVIYAINMYFQSYGAVSIIKVKAYWFHVRERGIFGAIFGTLISVGIYFAFDWGKAIVDMTTVTASRPVLLQGLVRRIFVPTATTVDATWAVFFIPAAILMFWAALDWWLIKDTPEEANFPYFETADASSGQMHVEFTTMDLLKKVFSSPVMLMIAVVELTSGVLRNGVTQWYLVFAAQTKQVGVEYFVAKWGFLLCIFGIVGGFAAGLISDKYFESRRGPPAALICGFALVMAGIMAAYLFVHPVLVACCGLFIVMGAIGITSLMSGTAATDFGGRKATATASGIVDAFAYLGSGLQSVSVGYLTMGSSWHWWPLFLMPFALIGCVVAIKIWNALPAATRKYLADVEFEAEPEAEAQLVSR